MVELRWAVQTTQRVNETRGVYYTRRQVLQYRNRHDIYDEEGNLVRSWWADWQDVPVVEDE